MTLLVFQVFMSLSSLIVLRYEVFLFICSRNMKEIKKTLVIGASEKPDRYSNIAIRKLKNNNIPVEAIALRDGKVSDVVFKTGLPELSNIHTITLYIGPGRQVAYYKYILDLKPKRIIFNPGTENAELEQLAVESGIDVIEHCTLVMLDSGQF